MFARDNSGRVGVLTEVKKSAMSVRREPPPTFLLPAAPAYGAPVSAPPLHLVLRAGEAHRAAMATAGKGGYGQHHHSKGKGKDRERVATWQQEAAPSWPMPLPSSDDGQPGPFVVNYSFAGRDEARAAWWRKVKAASKTPIYKTKLTWRVDQYLRGSYKAKDGLWYHSNTPKHRAAALLFYNKFIASDMPGSNYPTLKEWPDMYETGMWRLGVL